MLTPQEAFENTLKPFKNTFNKVKRIFKKPDNFLEATVEGGNASDIAGIFTRLWQTFSDLIGNVLSSQPVVSDQDNPDSSFNQFAYNKDGNPDSGLSAGGWLLVLITPASFVLGVIFRIFKMAREHYENSYKYMKRRLEAVGIEESQEKIAEQFDDFISRGKVGTLQSNHIKDKHETDQGQLKPNKAFRIINKVRKSSIGQLVGETWKLLSNLSFVYWLVYAPFLFVLGAAAISASLPVILLITLGISLTFATWKLIHEIRLYQNGKKEEPMFPQIRTNLNTTRRLKQRLLMKREHEKNMSMLKTSHKLDRQESDKKKKIKKLDQTYQISQSTGLIKFELLRKENNHENRDSFDEKKPITVSMEAQHDNAETGKDKWTEEKFNIIKNSALAQHLLGSVHERRARLAITTMNAVAQGFVGMFFIGWLISVIGVVLAPVAPIIGTVLVAATGNTSLTIAAGIVAILSGMKDMAKARSEQLSYEQRVYEKLSACYHKPEADGTILTKQEKFTQLEEAVKKQKTQVMEWRKKLKEYGATGHQLVTEYDLKKINVYNDYYFEKQRYALSKFTWAKKIGSRFYAFLGGGQTGLFVTRTLCLTGGILASLFVGTALGGVIGFVVAAAVAAAVVGGLKLAQYQLDRNQHHRDSFDIDERISYLKKKEKELHQLNGILEKNFRQVKEEAEKRDLFNELPGVFGEEVLPKQISSIHAKSVHSYFSPRQFVGRLSLWNNKVRNIRHTVSSLWQRRRFDHQGRSSFQRRVGLML